MQPRDAFILTTVFMSLLPLAMLGGLAWWVIRRLRQLDLEEQQSAQGPCGAPQLGAAGRWRC